jgi:ABC-2 type transport system permease protein
MSAPAAAAPTSAAPAPRLRGLVRSELRRATSRRALTWLTVLATLAVLGVAAIVFATTAAVDARDVAEAADRFRIEQQQFYEQCLADPAIPEAEKGNACWQPTEQDVVDNAIWSLPRRPFAQDDLEGMLSLAGGVGALVAIMLAASAGGADWGARTMGLLLSWEPRRLRVFLVRLGVATAIGTLVVGWLVAVALALGAAVGSAHGLSADALPAIGQQWQPVSVGDAAELARRWLPLGALAAAAGYALAMLTRSTGWAIGAAIGFVAIVESFVQGLWAWGSQWLVQTNVAAWLSGGLQWTVNRNPVTYSAAPLAPDVQPGTIFITDTRAIAWLSGLVVVGVLVSLVAFLRRDVE